MARTENYILKYYQHIRDGRVVVGKWVRLIFEYIIRGLEAGDFKYDARKARSAIEYIEEHCHHSEGDLAPNKIKLELWQKAILSCIFGIVDDKGNRQFREVVIVVARKNGKSLFASGVIQNCLYNDGEYGAKVFCVAPKLDQADLVYQAFWQSTQLSDDIAPPYTKSRKSDIYVSATNSSVKKIAFNAKKSDGFNPLLTVCDEIASWPGDKGLKQYEVMKSALGARRQPLILSISTSGYENDGIYDELIKRSTRFLLGDSKERRLLPFLYMIDDVTKWNDINELQKSNPNLGVSVSVDYLLEEIAVAEGSLSKKAEFLTKYCNVKQSSSSAWLPAHVVEKSSGDALCISDFKDCYCVGGIDLSQTRDLTACVAVFEKHGELYVFSKFFLPSAKIEEAMARDGVPYDIYVARGQLALSGENYVDYRDCYKWFCDLVDVHRCYPLKVGYDRYSAQYLVQDMTQRGFHMDDVYQGDNLWPVIQSVEGLFHDGKIHIGDNDLMKIHLLNTALKMNAERGRGRIVKISPRDHIDGAAALLDAMTMRHKYHREIGEQLKNTGKGE